VSPPAPAAVSIPGHDAGHEARIGPAIIEHRTAESGLTRLGTYFMTFDSEGHSDPWTVRYEETIYVISGEARLRLVTPDGESEVVAGPDALIVLPRDTTVRYGAQVGTRLLLSISPVNWRDQH
jgi:ethanolamine utilization protein EutQ (cupin superfamily)